MFFTGGKQYTLEELVNQNLLPPCIPTAGVLWRPPQ